MLSSVGVKVGSYPTETLEYMAARKLSAEEGEIRSTLRMEAGRIKRSGLDEAEQNDAIAKLALKSSEKINRRAAELAEKRRAAGLE